MLAQPADQAWNLGDSAATKTSTGIGRPLQAQAADHTNQARHTGSTTVIETPEPMLTHLAWRAGSAAASTESPEGGDR